MPIERDDHEERLARIEEMLATLKAEVERFSELHQRTVAEARLTRMRSEEARHALRKERVKRPKPVERGEHTKPVKPRQRR